MAGNTSLGAKPMPNNPPVMRRTFIHDLVMPARIGVYPHEQNGPQRIRVNVEAWTQDDPATDGIDRLDRVLNYERLRDAVHAAVAAGHVQLTETLAERIAGACLLGRVMRVRVRVEKLDVFEDAVSAGVEIERQRIGLSTSDRED